MADSRDVMHSRYDDTDLFMTDLHALRRASKNEWFFFSGKVNGKRVSIKSWGTGYLQIFRVDDIDQAAPMEMNVTKWDEFIRTRLPHPET